MSKEIKNRTVIITGASSGIGAGLATLFYNDGYNICLLARRKETLDTLIKDLDPNGQNSLALCCDITQKKTVHNAIQDCITQFGRIDCLVANAGIGLPSPADQFNASIYEKTFATNVFGAIYSFEAIIPHMIAQRSGQLVSISSLASYRGLPESGAYCSSKAALSSLTESLRLDLKKHRITVSLINPGFIKTPMTDRNQFYMPFLQSTEKGCLKIYTAIQKKKAIFAFPKPLSSIVKLLRFFPACLYDLCVGNRKNTKSPYPKD